jgi:translation initiation factor 3 subunit M
VADPPPTPGQLQDYLAFQKECADVLAAHHLVHDDCVAKMRLMSLAALGTESASGHVTYAQVQATLQVPAEEVERWVVKAIGASVLEAKMDQVQQQVIVTRSLHRVFGEQQWAELRSKLRVWRDNVAAVCATVAPAAAAASAQAVVV